jgi:hypothetical protein
MYLLQANQFLSLGNYTPLVISCGCVNRQIDITYRHNFCIGHRFIFYLTCRGPYLGLDL